MFSNVPVDIERKIWRSYMKQYVFPEIKKTFETIWIEVKNGDTVWSKKNECKVAVFKNTGTVIPCDKTRVPFPCMQGEAEFTAIIITDGSGRRIGFSRRWKTRNAGCPYWLQYDDPYSFNPDIPCRVMLRDKDIVSMQLGCVFSRKRRRNYAA